MAYLAVLNIAQKSRGDTDVTTRGLNVM